MRDSRHSQIRPSDVMTPKEVAEYLQLSHKTVLRRFEDGTLPGKKIGIKWRCMRTDLEMFLKSK